MARHEPHDGSGRQRPRHPGRDPEALQGDGPQDARRPRSAAGPLPAAPDEARAPVRLRRAGVGRGAWGVGNCTVKRSTEVIEACTAAGATTLWPWSRLSHLVFDVAVRRWMLPF